MAGNSYLPHSASLCLNLLLSASVVLPIWHDVMGDGCP
jgi:hypothetical protein